MNLSLIIPVFNEVENLPLLHQAIHQALDPLEIKWEAVLVDDGSTDGSQQVLDKQPQSRLGSIILKVNSSSYRMPICKTTRRTSP
jgi:glycosyltransferase involved in cell wall biosynthesis